MSLIAITRLSISLAFLLMSAGSVFAEERLKISVPLEDYDNHRNGYVMSVLRLALDHSGREYEIVPYITTANQGRSLQILSGRNPEFNLMWTGTSQRREKDLLPIRFPLTRGLLGIRLFIIHKTRQSDFDRVKNLGDLQGMLAGQGLNWPDTRILRHAGLKVEETAYANLLRLVSVGRIDYFPRGANEPYAELAAAGEDFPDLAVETGLAVAYPFDFFFFVNRRNTALHAILSRGLDIINRNGKFLENFNNHPDIKAIRMQANLDDRRVFVIDNPLLSPETRALPASLWATDFSKFRQEN